MTGRATLRAVAARSWSGEPDAAKRRRAHEEMLVLDQNPQSSVIPSHSSKARDRRARYCGSGTGMSGRTACAQKKSMASRRLNDRVPLRMARKTDLATTLVVTMKATSPESVMGLP